MIDLKVKRDQATLFRKQGSFDKAIPLFEELWNETKDKWDGWGLANCLCKTKDFEKALNISKEVYKADTDFNLIRATYTWSAYMLHIKDFGTDDNYETLKSYGSGILKLSESNHEDMFRQLTVQKIMEFCENKGMWDAVVAWSGKINGGILNNQPYEMKSNGKNITIPSNREKFFLKITKAYEKLEKWSDCLEKSCEALDHFPDEIWFQRRKAISEGHIGNIEQAIEDLTKISLVKSDWFIFRDIAVFYAKNGNIDKALDFIIEGCIASAKQPDPGYRWELYYNAASFLQKSGDTQMAKKHLLLSYSLRNNEGWKTKEVISTLASEMDLVLEGLMDTNNYLQELKQFWEKYKFANLPKHTGQIKTMLPNGKAGFITSNDGKDYYFKVFSFNGSKKKIKSGFEVDFFVQESFDKSKNKKSFQAVNITVSNHR